MLQEHIDSNFSTKPTFVPNERRRGRGSLTNASGRFEPLAREAFDDGWENDEPLPKLKTEVTLEKPRKIITYNTSPDIPFDRSINAYRGCEHGCSYCFARPSHAYMGLSAGLDFETKLFAKPDAHELLERELASASYVVKPIALGTNTDPYQPIERKYEITRRILGVLNRLNHPVTIVTKSHLVTRDADILAEMAVKNLVKVALSITTLDRALARAMEPRAATPSKRLEALRLLSECGVPTMVMVAPVIPGLNDAEIEKILEESHAAGAREANYVLLRMPHEIKDLFREWLFENRPNQSRRVMSLLKDMRGGRDYDATFGARMAGTGVYAEFLAKRFHLAKTRLGFSKTKIHLDCSQFIQVKKSTIPQQLALF
jgi:DNA repair photolyase